MLTHDDRQSASVSGPHPTPGNSRPGSPSYFRTPQFGSLAQWTLPSTLLHFVVGLAALGLVNLTGECFGWTPWHGLSAFLVFAYLLVALLLTDVLVFFLSFSLSATLAPMVASSAYIEFGNRISEQGVNGFATGSTTRLVFYVTLFYLGVYLVARALINRIQASTVSRWAVTFCAIARWLHASVLTGAVVLLVAGGSPLLRGEDRFAYWSSLPSVFNRLPFLIAMLCFLTVCAAAVRPTKRAMIWAASLLVGSIVVLLLLSEKFTGLFQVFLFSVMAAYVARIYHRNIYPRIGRLLGLCVVAGVALLSSAAMGYIVFYNYTLETVIPKLTDRVLALHGHVWFGIDRGLQQGDPLGPVSALVATDSDGLTGIQQLMYLVAPNDFVDRMIAGGLRFANAGFPLPVWTLGYGWATLFFLLAGMLTGAVLAYLMFAVAKLRILSILVALNALKQVSNAFLVGDIADLYKPLALLTWAWILIDLVYTWYRGRGTAIRAGRFVNRKSSPR
jgi:hypothetical protein